MEQAPVIYRVLLPLLWQPSSTARKAVAVPMSLVEALDAPLLLAGCAPQVGQLPVRGRDM